METIVQIRRIPTGVDAHGLDTWFEVEYRLTAAVATRQNNSVFSADFVSVTDGLTVYLPANTEVEDGDKFEVRGKRYEIDGEPFDWRDGFSTWTPGTVVNLVRETNG